MQNAPFLKKDFTEAEALLKKGKVGQVLFSEGTYQIEVRDAKLKASLWPFFQIDDEGRVLDFFCTCSTAEKKKSCPHLAAGLLKIFNNNPQPLHVRFRDSLWNQLCQIASRRHGYDVKTLKEEEGFSAVSVTGKRLFSVKARNPAGRARLKEVLFNRAIETEETSLKFSNLSAEELALWREGRPSHQLRFELSFWSDLAKWWMFLQDEGEDYKLTFIDEEQEGIPKWVQVRFPQVEFSFYVSEANWPQVIPALATVNSPLPVFEFQQQMIRKIEYDLKENCLRLDFTQHLHADDLKKDESSLPPSEKSYKLGEWIFVPHKGFYPSRVDPLLSQKMIPKSKVSTVLQKHFKIIRKYLVGTKVHSGIFKANYLLYFDSNNNLHIGCYVFEPGDLQKESSAYFGPWVFLEEKGFYLLENLLFDGVEKVISKDNVSDFVNRHRLWLNAYDGFQTHVSSMESHLTYHLSKKDVLHFDSRLDVAEESGDILDFGDWIYVKGRGFYAKMTRRTGALLRPGLTIKDDVISGFIHAHKEELEHILGFFAARTPIEKTGLNILLNEKKQIVVRPEFFYFPSYSPERVKIFGDYTFVEKEGFCEVPSEMRLPDLYTREKTISSNDEAYFVAYELDALRPFILTIDQSLRKPKDLFLRINRIKKDEKSKVGAWMVDLGYESEHGSVGVNEIWQAINENKRYLFTPAGLIMLKQPRFNWLKSITKKRWLKQGQQVRLSTLEWIRLNVFDEIREPQGNSRDAIESRKVIEEFKSFQTQQLLDLEGLKSDLRQYQETGVKWLWFLYCNGLSGLLCDEMGLGKTHQAMALIAAVMNAGKDLDYKILVVCPTSVIYHWEDLLKRFLPKLRVLVFYGVQRKLEIFEENYDLLLTSYGTMRSEKKGISKIPFEIAVFDEVQIAKNAHSQTHKAMGFIDAKVRLGLTGTPIENRLLELKSLFDVVLPGYMPVESVFKELFVNPIEKGQDAEKKFLLSRLVKPFILRRKKAEVLLELPEKIEEVSYCALSDEQRELYRKTVLGHREGLLKDLKDNEKPVPLMHVFALFSTLKQICDHPCLINKQFEEFQKHQSGKWDLFVELLHETRDSGQKLVVFSQYLDMLNMIEAYLKEKGIGFAGIRGSTRNRKQQLDKFRDDPQCEVFVASLQAAGVGVDLVSASVVIHYDRWWNPAKENQATDRVHRIGQNRGVQVFKLVTKGTIEEHIHRLIESKLKLMEGVIGFDDQDQIKGLERDELIEILKILNRDVEKEF